MRYLLITLLFTSCVSYPNMEHEAIDNKGKRLIIHEHKGSYTEHQHNVGDTVVIHTGHGIHGLISETQYNGKRVPTPSFKNVIITNKK